MIAVNIHQYDGFYNLLEIADEYGCIRIDDVEAELDCLWDVSHYRYAEALDCHEADATYALAQCGVLFID